MQEAAVQHVVDGDMTFPEFLRCIGTKGIRLSTCSWSNELRQPLKLLHAKKLRSKKTICLHYNCACLTRDELASGPRLWEVQGDPRYC